MKKITLAIKGMHCSSCNIFIKDQFKKIKNIKKVEADFRSQKAEVYFEGNLNLDKINHLIKPYGYQIVQEKEVEKFGGKNNWIDFVVLLIFFITIGLILKEINLFPDFSKTSLSLPMVFFLGIAASLSTCMATAGVLYLAVSQRNNRLTSALSFSFGRILSYGFFGFVVGLLGKSLISSAFFSALLTLIIGLAMVFLGLELARVFSWQRFFNFGFSGRIFEFFEQKLNYSSLKTPFFLGAITYFLPCGFTQSVQIYSISLGNPLISSLNMIVFALGTIPLIILINKINQIRQMNFHHYFIKSAGVLVFLIGFYYFFNFLTLVNLNPFDQFFLTAKDRTNQLAPLVNGKQEIRMTVDGSGYQPNYFEVKKEIPVRWVIDGKNVFGCQGYFLVPDLKVAKTLKPGENIIEFKPEKEGEIKFACGMGMYKGVIKISP